jgi:hypothetical protein
MPSTPIRCAAVNASDRAFFFSKRAHIRAKLRGDPIGNPL